MLPRVSKAIAVLLLAAACAPFAGAQNAGHGPTPDQLSPRRFDTYRLGMRVSLGPDWLFSPDDNPAYASPTFDDSGWQTISANKQLTDYGVHDIPFAWYRIHVHVNPNWDNLAVEVQYIAGSYELYVNGVRIGTHGKMVGMLESGQQYLTSYEIPDSLVAPNGDLVIAMRFAVNKTGDQGSGSSTPLTTDCVFIAHREQTVRDAGYEAFSQSWIHFMHFGLNLLVGLVALALYLAMRNQPEYLAIAVSLLAASFQASVHIFNHLRGYTAASDFLEWLAIGIATVAILEFVRLLVQVRRSRWLLALEVAIVLGRLALPLYHCGFSTGPVEVIGLYSGPALIAVALAFALLLRAALRGNRDARLFLPPYALVALLNYWGFLLDTNSVWHWTKEIPPMTIYQFASYGVNIWDAWDVIFCVTMLLFLVLRTIGIAHERAQAAAELEAARTVQHVLIPEETPSVPGFAIHSVYKPAGQVGGDFFQILPMSGGGVLVVIGDVSGKGLPAAMTVSLLVGTVRTLAHYTRSPGEILAAMNQRMMARSNGGFTTCLVLRADGNGTLTMANAGHFSPYLNGKELPLKNGLPLGLSSETTYAESTFQLAPEQQLTLLTDGVVEARDKTGALFGFERTAALSTRSAEAIAQAAQAYGQDDDITVLTLARTA
jgi:hypothetical protein